MIPPLPKGVTLLAATKTHTAEEILPLIKEGIAVIGENYVQEAQEKAPPLKGKVKIHLIGHLQSNKVGDAAELFDMIETIDAEKTAQKLDDECKKQGKIMPVLIEVNSGREPQKHGVLPEEVERFIGKIGHLPHLAIKGMMTMGPAGRESRRKAFAEMKTIFDRLRAKHPGIDTLSMGMSDSYEDAIAAGATEVRLGTILFGER